jgi:uncharacterized protein
MMTGEPGAEAVRRSAELDQSAWAALTGPEDFYLSLPWLRAAEVTAEGAPCVHVEARDGSGALVAGSAAYLLDATSPFVFCRPDMVLSPDAVPGRTPADLMPTLSAGGRNPSHSRVMTAPDLADRGPGLAAVLRSLEAEAAHLGAASVSFLYVDEDDPDLRVALLTRGYLEAASGGAAVLALPGTGPADYEVGLSAARRGAVRRDHRKVASSAIMVDIVPLTSDRVPRMLELEANLYRRYGTPYVPERMGALYTALALGPAGPAQLSLGSLDGEMVGFALWFRQSEIIHARCVGFDYERIAGLPLYFELLYHRLIEAAYAGGVREIRYSSGSLATKASRGCDIRTEYAYVLPLG